MATKLGEVYVVLKGNNAHLAKTLKQSKSQIKNFAKSANRLYTGLGASITNIINRSFNQIFHTLKRVAEFTAIAAAGIGIAIGKLAIDAVESENLFAVSMGGMEASTRRWSMTMAKAFDLNEFTIRKNVGTFNVMLKSMGVVEKNAETMAQQMTDLAFNMASFYNLSHEEAFNKIRSGLVGMTKPLQNIGILTKVSTLEAYVAKNREFAESIGYTTGQLTELQKVYTRFAVIQEQTELASNDLARTMDEGANIFRAIKDNVMELGVALGNVVLPYIEKFGMALRDGIGANQDMVVGMFTSFISKAKELGQEVLPFLIETIAMMARWITDSIDHYRAWGEETGSLIENLEGVRNTIGVLVEVFSVFWDMIASLIAQIATLTGGLQDMVEWLGFSEMKANNFANAIGAAALIMLYFSRTTGVLIKGLVSLSKWFLFKMIPAIIVHVIQLGVLITTYGIVAGSMIAVKLAAIAMWTAIGGPIGLIIAGIILVGLAAVALVAKFRKASKKEQDEADAQELKDLENKIRGMREGETEEDRDKRVKASKDKLMAERKAAQEEININREKKLVADKAAAHETKLLKDKLAKEKAANKERLREYKATLKKLRDSQKEIVRVGGPGDVSFAASRKVAQNMSGVGHKTIEKEERLVKAMEEVKHAIENEGQRQREDDRASY